MSGWVGGRVGGVWVGGLVVHGLVVGVGLGQLCGPSPFLSPKPAWLGRPPCPALPCSPRPAHVCLQEIREQMRTLAKQLHQFDERLQYMEQAMGRKRSWLPLFGG